jgi:hypothetical protein
VLSHSRPATLVPPATARIRLIVLLLFVTNNVDYLFLFPGFFAAGAFPCSFYQTLVV